MTAPAMDESAEIEATVNEFMMARDTAEVPMKQQSSLPLVVARKPSLQICALVR